MKKIYLVFLLSLFVTGVLSQNRQEMNSKNYEKEWAKVAYFENKSLPKSALEHVDLILRKAIEDKNSPQVIKALIHEGKYNLVRDNQSDTLIFGNLNEMIELSIDVVEQSVLHSMLGELYLQYYQKDKWAINQRTELGDFVPSDMKEWTKNNFYDKAIEHLNASLKDELTDVKVETYTDIVEFGKDSRRFFPSMYDFLVRRAIDFFRQFETDEDLSRTLAKKGISTDSLFTLSEVFTKINFNPQPKEYNLWTLETYRKLIESLTDRGLMHSVLLTEMDKLDYLTVFQNAYSTNALPYLESLLQKWVGNEFSVEIIDKIASLRESEIVEFSSSDSLKRDQKKEELYNLLVDNIKKYSNYERISVLENRLQRLIYPSFRVSGNSTFPIKKEKRLNLTYNNLKSLTAKLYQIDSPLDVQMAQSGIRRNIEVKRTFIKNIDIPLKKIPEYIEGSRSFTVDIETPGIYMLIFSSDPEIESNGWNDSYYFAVSDLTVLSRSSSRDKYDFFVVDRETGEPVDNARIHIYKLPNNWRNSVLTAVETLTTNSDGYAVYNKNIPNNDVFYHAVKGKDNGSILNRLPFSYSDYTSTVSATGTDKQVVEQIDIFTDRSLYRPGQTVYYKAILSQSEDNVTSVLANKTTEFILRDANNREVSKQLLKSNDFGSVTGEFILPQGLLPGRFMIESEKGNVAFQVEEYKRPTFEVTFDKIEETYKFGEYITLKGKAENFSGIKLQNATVEWRIIRNQSWWWSWRSSPEHFAEGVSLTDNDGTFEISFTPEKSDSQISSRAVYSFVVEATVTDINGETQIGRYTVNVGDVSMILQAEIADRLDKDSDDNIIISAKNLDGVDIFAKGRYMVFSLQENDSIDKQMFHGIFETGVQKEIKDRLSRIESGKYKLQLESEDDRGNKIEAERDFILYSITDKQPPIKTNNWFIEKNRVFSLDKDAEIILGVSDKVNVLYELWQENNLIKREWIELNKENHLFSFPYNESYKNGLTLHFNYVKDEEFYSHRVELRQEKETKKLDIRLDVFRDKIRPGAFEEWRISVTDANGNPAIAEVLASMYDFSLDNIYKSDSWNISTYAFDRYKTMNALSQDRSFSTETATGSYQLSMKDVKQFVFDRFNWFGFSLYNYGRIMFRSGMVNIYEESIQLNSKNTSALSPSLGVDAPQYDINESEVFKKEDATSGEVGRNSQDQREGQPYIRRNFNETAFFFPQLKTNDEGGTQIAFTVPESNTRWRFRVLAHNKNLNNGVAEAFTVSQKELMVTPSIPRFLRHGDITSISAKVSNLSSTIISGNVKFEFFNPVTEEIISDIELLCNQRELPHNQDESSDNIDELLDNSKEFTLEAGASSDVSWTFKVPSDIDLLGIRIIAESDLFSDGEQHALAVLPNRMMVTESMRMDLNGNEEKTFTMESLVNKTSKSESNYRLTLEFTSNPAWYAIQSLPVLGQPVSDNAVAWFASYYANTLGNYIGKAYPRVASIIEAWKKQGGNEGTFLSNLEKNSELKNVLLEETPWVLEAKNESEQKEKFSLLFDLNRSHNLTQTALDKLHELQTTQGGWSWFKGFNPNVGITQYILYGFNQLKSLNAIEITDEIQSMQSQAISYIDAEAIRRFDNLKKYNRNWKNIKTISTFDLEYLFVRSAYDDYPIGSQERELISFYTSVITKNWTAYGLYERSLIAILMYREGNRDIMKNILDSYREHATVSEEMGMYWPNNRANVFISQSAVTVHTFIMEAFRVGGADNAEMDNMKRWLLKQKQTQMWESTHATTDAVYTLLSSGSDWFAEDGKTTILVGSQLVDTDKGENGTGYVKESWSKGNIVPEMGSVTVTHKGDSPAWGALYRQYYDDLDKVTKSDASLDIEKLLFIEKTDSEGSRLMRITDDNQLKVGDKVVVRLTIRADRDFEFVHLKDMRSAAFESVDQISSINWQNGVIYYKTSKDASTNFYFDVLPRGTYVLEYSVYVTRKGSYSNGISTIQCMYAPEFTSHTQGFRIEVDD